ncbi:NAD(P)H-quinone oxidoreductase [Halopseudomonas aestusnigri]|uniref:NAD(P)H quinone oxidoreductase, PIG3 family n=1 Tax=Halopseudomonas aestusnigri TaxID=857252 RepID=A0AAQ1G954_9GAMM|nr:NAD(P)H-quinone oxidoreductase [Halopseudomonas aestusnigri]OWL86147.1 NAD(P)H-quinone oxidoreductase [Halopseudomonas aestusnigri]SEG60188.1 putative NAD(P)H quinone oxidoreductase, PIG3 family [Halopseudomonas aestusnigri]
MRGLQAEGGELSWQVQPAAELKSGEVRVRVMAAGLNRADLLQKAGMYPPPPGVTRVLGLECAGEVIEVTEGARWKIGDRVCALLAGGGMAEEVVVDQRHLLAVPDNLNWAEAAAIPEVFSTAWLNVFVLGNARPGEKVLIHAGASGVGTAAIQLCKAQGNPCWVSVGSQDKLDACVELGAEGGVLRQGGIAALKDFGPFNVALDPVGATYAADHLDLLALDARWVLIGLMGGRDATLDLAKVLAKRISLIGSTLRTRDAEFKATLLADMEQRLMPQFASGELKPMVAKTFGFADAAAAFEELARDQVVGKVILVRED